MVRQTNDWKQELFDKRVKYGLYQLVDCSEEDNEKYAAMVKNGESLPENVRQYRNKSDQPVDVFYRIYDSGLSESERMEYLSLKALESVEFTKNCVMFLVALIVISFLFGLISIAF